jgi:major membrane immunogen (membrane-anchored lipoprotein)
MKRILGIGIIAIQVVFLSMCSKEYAKDGVTSADTISVQSGNYKNGDYEGQTKIDYEGYHAFAQIKVAGGYIDRVDWGIFDNNRKRNFDSTYEEVYAGNALYQQQCRDNIVGMEAFGPKLIGTQDIDKVDGITGATWCYNKFKEVVKITLKDAVVDSVGAVTSH